MSASSVRLLWTPPLGDVDGVPSTPRSYRVWRGSEADAPLFLIAEVTAPTFVDGAAVGPFLIYDVTPVW